MKKSAANDARTAVLDDHVIKVYVREVHKLVADVRSVSIYGARGERRWSSSDDEPQSVANLDIGAPAKQAIAGGRFAFDFPLASEEYETLVLRLTVDSLDPPSLKFVASSIAPALECLGRQIRIDTSLTARIAVSDTNRVKLEISDALDDLPAGDSVEANVRELLAACRALTNCHSVATYLPSQRMLLAVAQDGAAPLDHKGFLPGLMEKQVARPRPFSARLKLANGQRLKLVCAPVAISRGSVDGIAVIFCEEPEGRHSVAVRSVAQKISELVQTESPHVECGNRYDLLIAIDRVLEAGTAGSHSLIYFNIDKTHTINDAFGYSTGDKALAQCQRIFAECAKGSDIVAHLGGDRFAMFMPGASIDTAMTRVDKALRFLAQETIEDGRKSIKLSASAGVACSDSISKGGEELLILAEVAARGARERGGGQYATFQDVDNSIIQRRSDVDKVGFLQTALIENRFTLHAQRILPINTDMTHKFELLARLTDKNIDNGSAHQFLAAAERYQMMAALDRWVVNSALKSLSEAENSLEVSLSTFCINVSAQSLQDDTFVDHIEARISETGVSPDSLCFEITETSLVRHIDRAQHFVSRLQQLGCQVALDDFGTGYSSFSYLKSLPINILKIDGTFVRDILECRLSKTIVSSVVRMAEDIGARTVAEHVENELVRAQLKDLGVHYIQGYVVHRPEPLENVLRDFDASLVSTEELLDDAGIRSDALEQMVSSSQ